MSMTCNEFRIDRKISVFKVDNEMDGLNGFGCRTLFTLSHCMCLCRFDSVVSISLVFESITFMTHRLDVLFYVSCTEEIVYQN